MKIKAFRIENFKNIRFAASEDTPNFLVICGGNGSGKSALLRALMTLKEHSGPYGSFLNEAGAVSADAEHALISMTISFSPQEREFVKAKTQQDCPEVGETAIRLQRNGASQRLTNTLGPANMLLGYYSRIEKNSPGFFDYIEAYRQLPRVEISNWTPNISSEQMTKQTLAAPSTNKFQNTKAYLASLVMRDLQDLQRAHRSGEMVFTDSLAPIKTFFNEFFAPMKFVDVRIDETPFRYIISTPRGDIDIDDLSGGEKEVLTTFIRFHQLQPRSAVILFDEADAHLHPDLERRYLNVLRKVSEHNQVWLTTHSPEMMIAAGADSLFTIIKYTSDSETNQFQRVSSSDQLHAILSEVMGSRGLVSFNQRIIFIEGEEASADREVYEQLYPPSSYNVSFVPAGNSSTIRKTAERVNELLSSSMGFQQFYSIVDGDMERAESALPPGRLFRLPVYHVENFLIDSALIFELTKEMLRGKCPYSSVQDVEDELKRTVLTPAHMRPFTAALLDAKVAAVANEAYDSIYRKQPVPTKTVYGFEEVEPEAAARMTNATEDGTWGAKCKGREVLREYCRKNEMKYEHFRNALIAKLKEPPPGLKEIMKEILK